MLNGKWQSDCDNPFFAKSVWKLRFLWIFYSALIIKCSNGFVGRIRVLECELKLNSILWLFECSFFQLKKWKEA